MKEKIFTLVAMLLLATPVFAETVWISKKAELQQFVNSLDVTEDEFNAIMEEMCLSVDTTKELISLRYYSNPYCVYKKINGIWTKVCTEGLHQFGCVYRAINSRGYRYFSRFWHGTYIKTEDGKIDTVNIWSGDSWTYFDNYGTKFPLPE